MPVKQNGQVVSVAPIVIDGVTVGATTAGGSTYMSGDIVKGNTHYNPDTKIFVDFISLAKGAEFKSPNKPWTPAQKEAYVWLLKLEYKGMSVAGMKNAIDGYTQLTYAEELAEAGVPNYNTLAAKAGVTPGFLKVLVESSPEQMRKDLGDIAIAKALVESDKNLLVELVALVEAGGEQLDPQLYAALQKQLVPHSFPIRKKIIQLSPVEQQTLRERRAELLGVDPSQVDVERTKVVKQGVSTETKVSLPILIGGAALLWFLIRGK